MIHALSIRGFRNLEEASFLFSNGVHALLGGTGAGKTSVLEAMYAAATTRSFRVARLAECAREPPLDGPPNSSGFRVALEAHIPHPVDLEISWQPEAGSQRRRNQQVSRLVEHVGTLPILVCSSQEVVGLLEGPAPRRRQIDRGLIAERPALLDCFSRYRRVLEQKRAALQQRASAAVLDALDDVFAESAAEWVRARAFYVERWNAALREFSVALGPDLRVMVRYEPSVQSVDVEGWLDALARARRDEQRACRVLRGPHLDRVEIVCGERQRRAETLSAGERKSAALLLVAAQREVLRAIDRTPVLLLDDVDAELDRRRLEQLWPVLTLPPQTFVSSNRPEAFSERVEATRWVVREGRIGSA